MKGWHRKVKVLVLLQPTNFCQFKESQTQVAFIMNNRSKLPVTPSTTKKPKSTKKPCRCRLCMDAIYLSHSLSLSFSLCYIFFLCRLYQFGGYILVLYVAVSLTKVISYSHCKYFEMHIFNFKGIKIKSGSLYYKEFFFGGLFVSVSDIC